MYIINPSWFYLLHVIDCLSSLLGLTCAFATIALIVATIMRIIHFCETGGFEDDDDIRIRKFLNKCLKISAIITFVTMIALIFLPSKQTLIEMQIARYATYENAEWTVEAVKSAVDYIVEAVNSIK